MPGQPGCHIRFETAIATELKRCTDQIYAGNVEDRDFHEDDAGDADWHTSFTVPTEGLETGVYAVKLQQSNRWIDWVPFFVRPPTPQAPVAFLVPTASCTRSSSLLMHQLFSRV